MSVARQLGYVLLVLLVLAPATITIAPVVNAQDEEYIKVTVLETTKFTNLTSYMYDSVNKKLEAVNTSYVQVLDYELKDLSATDDYMPAVLLTLDAPTTDLNTNESIVYAWVLTNSYGDSLLAAVADINETDNSIINIQYFKISPVSGDVAIVRTNYDIIIEGNGYKLSIPLANFSNPRILIMTDSQLLVGGISELELRALRNPPSGYTLLRNGSGESVFTISASGWLYVWFDETHDNGDVDLFIYDSSDPDYDDASLERSWGWHTSHATAYTFADYNPGRARVEAHGSVKFVVKRYSGSTASWRVAVRLGSSVPEQTQTYTPSQSQTQTQTTTTTGIGTDLLARLHGVFENNNNIIIYVIIALLFVIILIVALKR